MTREQYEREKIAERHKAYLEAVQPLIKAATDALSCYMPTMILYPDGHMTSEYPEEAKKIMAQYQELIETVARSFQPKTDTGTAGCYS